VKRTVILLIALFACKKTEVARQPAAAQAAVQVASAATPVTLPPGHPAIDSATTTALAASPVPAAPPASMLTGNVIETLDAGGYTYVHVKAASGDEWAAVPQASIKKGSSVSIAVQMAMENFESKTLGRKFKRVLFGTIANGGNATPSLPAGHPATAGGMRMPPQQMSSAAADAGEVNVARADGGKSVAEVWAQKATLKETAVVVRGKVVKFLPSIMGKNWLHLRDGSGSAKGGDNDLVVTTNDSAKAGDVVTIKGTVHTDKDFGAGYSYAVIVEDAAIVK
jgi:hypothetical protein